MVKTEPPIQPAVHPTPPNSASASAKRKPKDDPDQPGQTTKKKPRTRVSYSCGECHRRKQKCDRQMPCSHCIARKVPDLCKAYTPGKSDQDVHARLSRLEHIIEVALPQFANGPISGPSSPVVDASVHSRVAGSRSLTPDDEGSQAEDGDIGVGTFDKGGKWFGNSVSGSVAPVTMLEQLTHVGPSSNGATREQKYAASANRSKTSVNAQTANDNEPESPLLQPGEPTAADLLQGLIRDCGLSENKLHELMQELPSKQFTDLLIDYYFKNMNWTRYPISEQDFRASYAALFVDGVGSNPNDIRFLPLLFIILAISVRLCPEDIGGNAHERRLKSSRFYWSSRRALLVAAAIQPDSLEMVVFRLLSARYLTFDRRITECWSQLGAAVCTAQALGLHRDPAGMRLEPAQAEYRRRIWAYLYHADRSYSMVLGRPYAIQDEYTTTQPPLNIEDLSTFIPLPSAPPLSQPTKMTFVILRHKLAYIIGKMVHYFQRCRVQNHYSEVLALDDDLQKFVDTLPPHFSFNPDTSLDRVEQYSYIPVHRYLLITEIHFVRMSLHRPYILRKLDSDRYVRSRRACFSAAIMDFDVRRSFRRTQSKNVLRTVSNAYREFQTAMISGIYLVLEPNGKEADIMHLILDTFLRDHEGHGPDELDETTRRELKIVELLKNKALQAKSQGGVARRSITGDVSSGTPADQGTDAQANANLLLSLQQSRGALQHTRSSSESAAASPSTRQFPSLTTKGIIPTSGVPPVLVGGVSANGMGPLPHSPTLQRLQAQTSGVGSRHSPVGTGSPSENEDMSAQNMLDHWCNAVTNPPPLPLDQYVGNNNSLSSGQWGTLSTGVSSGPADWLNTPYLLNSDSGIGSGLEGADYNYWESLVNTIRGGPIQ